MSDTSENKWIPAKWYVGTYCALVVGVFCLLALGGSVRIMKAGLACPDWPLCFGDVIPDYHPQVYFEFIHRVVAGCVTIVTLALQFMLFRSRAPRAFKILGGLSLVVLATQIVFGGLTVLLLLQAGVVETHLLMGTAFFATLLWIYLSLKSAGEAEKRAPRWLRAFCWFVAAAVYGQIFMGGRVASNFASLVCIDFPTCHGQWIPTLSGQIGIHVMHRLGGYCIFAIASLNWFLMLKFGNNQMRKLAAILFLCVCGQIGLGIANIIFLLPPLVAVSHLALAIGVFSVAIRQLHAAYHWGAVSAPAYKPRAEAAAVGASPAYSR